VRGQRNRRERAQTLIPPFPCTMLFVDADQPIIKYLKKAQYDTDCEIGQQAHAGLISIEDGEDADEVISRFMRWLKARSSGPSWLLPSAHTARHMARFNRWRLR